MNRNVKQMIKEARIYPNPVKKDQFIRRYRKNSVRRKTGGLDMIRSQVGYIRMPVWIVSIAALVVALVNMHSDINVVTIVAAFIPFVSGVAVFESFRSRMYGMTEMEGVTLYSLQGMLFARVVCVGIVHFVLLIVLAIILGKGSGYGFFMTGAVITVPYLFSSIASMELERTTFGRKNAFGCLIISMITSIAVIFARSQSILFAEAYHAIWYSAVIILFAVELVEIRKMFRWEEYVWN